MMKTEYVHTLDGVIVKHRKWYVDNLKIHEKHKWGEIDRWCLRTFGAWRHDNEINEGWWLQDENEYTVFLLTWAEEMNG